MYSNCKKIVSKGMKAIKLRKFILLLCVVCVVSLAGGCRIRHGQLWKEASETTVITFKDRNLEISVRNALGKPEGTITIADAQTVTELNVNKRVPRVIDSFMSDTSHNITCLDGLQYFINLKKLNLQGNSIKDITPLQHLEKLKELDISCNFIHNIDPLKSLTHLEKLTISWNGITNIQPLEKLKNLKELSLGSNAIFGPIGYEENKISDISALKGMRELVVLDLQDMDALMDTEEKRPTDLPVIQIKGNNAFSPNEGIEIFTAKKLIAQYIAENGTKGEIEGSLKVEEITVKEAWENGGLQIYRVDLDYAWLYGVAVIKQGKVLCVLEGMPTFDVFLGDLDKDGNYEIYTNITFGSGIISAEIRGYNVATGTKYVLSKRMQRDLAIFIQHNALYVKQYKYAGSTMMEGEPIEISRLVIEGGDILGLGIS